MKAAGLNVIGIAFQAAQTDYSSQVASAASDAQSFLSSGGTTHNTVVACGCDEVDEDENIFTHAMSDQPLSSLTWTGIEAIDTPALLDSSVGPWMNHVNFTISEAASFSSPQLSYFDSTFQAAYGTQPEPYSNYAYDNTWVAMLAVLIAGSYNGPDILMSMPIAADHYFGATGTGVWLDMNNEQTFAYYTIVRVRPSQRDGFNRYANRKLQRCN